jgi:hypothetical protein
MNLNPFLQFLINSNDQNPCNKKHLWLQKSNLKQKIPNPSKRLLKSLMTLKTNLLTTADTSHPSKSALKTGPWTSRGTKAQVNTKMKTHKGKAQVGKSSP